MVRVEPCDPAHSAQAESGVMGPCQETEAWQQTGRIDTVSEQAPVGGGARPANQRMTKGSGNNGVTNIGLSAVLFEER